MIRDDIQADEVPVLCLPYALRDGRRREIRVTHRLRPDGTPYSATLATWDIPEYGEPRVLGYLKVDNREVPAILDALATLAG